MKMLPSLSVKRAIWILLAIPLLTVSAEEAEDKSEKSKDPVASEKSKDPVAANNIGLGLTVAKKGQPASDSRQAAIENAVIGFPALCTIEPVGPDATVLTGDDNFLDVSNLLPAGKSFTFFGKRFGPEQPGGGIFVGTNGYITFGRGVTNFSESLEALATLPMLAAFWHDLVADAANPVTIEFNPSPNRLVATWNHVREFGVGGSNTFQITLFLDTGAYQFVYDGIESTAAVVGVSQGLLAVVESDLSAQLATIGRQLRTGYLAERFGGAPVDAFDLDQHCVRGAALSTTGSLPVVLVR